MTDPSPATTPAAPDVDARLSKVESELNALETKLKRDARFTLFVALVLLGLLTGYFWYGYTQFDALFQPKELVGLVAAIVDENVQPVRESLETEIEKQAPILAQNLSDQAIAAIPDLREQLEVFLMEQSSKTVDQVLGDSTARFDDILEQHRPEIQALISEMKERDQASAEVLATLETVINEEIGQDMQANAEEVLKTLSNLTDGAMRLKEGQGLTDEEQNVRQFAMIVRRLQLESADPGIEIQGEMSKPIIVTPPTDADAPPVGDPGDTPAADKPDEAATDKPENDDDSADKPENEKPAAEEGDAKPAETESEGDALQESADETPPESAESNNENESADAASPETPADDSPADSNE